MKLKKIFSFCFIAFFFSLLSCSSEDPRFVIGISQCSITDWRLKLKEELELTTYFHNIELRMTFAHDDDSEQSRQIDSLVNTGLDLLIVSPNQVQGVSSSIKKAKQKNIPVILYDRKADNLDYDAFMGADNYSIGKLLAEFIVAELNYKGNIVEIGGLKGSSPAIERHLGFRDVLKNYPDIHIVAFENGDWNPESGKRAMETILQNYKGSVNCVFGANDAMTIEAKKVLLRQFRANPETFQNPDSILFVGIDALPTPGGGLENVRDGNLTASAIYPIRGDALIELALKILRKEPYKKENFMETSIVTAENANVLLLQHKEIESMHHYISKMYKKTKIINEKLEIRQLLSIVSCIITGIVFIFSVIILHFYKIKLQLKEEIQKKEDELDVNKALTQQQQEELEEQTDKLLDIEEQLQKTLPENQKIPENNAAENLENNAFYQSFLEHIRTNLSDAELSVETLSQKMCMSRVQLYRKIKSFTDKTPVEILREERLLAANKMLEDRSLSISEIAYRSGFSAPSYFTKCYKEFFGKSPR